MVQLNPTHSFVQWGGGGGGGGGGYRILKLQPFLNFKDLSKFSYSSDHHELRLLPDTEKKKMGEKSCKMQRCNRRRSLHQAIPSVLTPCV